MPKTQLNTVTVKGTAQVEDFYTAGQGTLGQSTLGAHYIKVNIDKMVCLQSGALLGIHDNCSVIRQLPKGTIVEITEYNRV